MNTNVNRIDRFLRCPDLEEQSSSASTNPEDESSAVKFKNADYSWTGNTQIINFSNNKINGIKVTGWPSMFMSVA